MIVNNIEFNEPEYICPECGNKKLSYKYLESNKSIQARCSNCDKWYGNIKYDNRSKEQIRRDKINNWLKERE